MENWPRTSWLGNGRRTRLSSGTLALRVLDRPCHMEAPGQPNGEVRRPSPNESRSSLTTIHSPLLSNSLATDHWPLATDHWPLATIGAILRLSRGLTLE